MILFEKFGQHQPLNRQAERYAREGVPISLSTLADQVGACCAVLAPLFKRIEAHVLAAERLHGDDTTVPVLAKGKTDTGRCWVYVRDDRPFGGPAPPAAMFYYSRDRGGEHPQAHLAGYAGILQADAYGGYNKLYEPTASLGRSWRRPAGSMPGGRSSCMADLAENARRKAARQERRRVISPLALEAVRRIDALFEIERAINGQSAERAPGRPPGAERAAGRRSRGLDARAARQALARQRSSPRRWTTCSSAGPPSPASSTTAASACRTMPPNGRCAASLWAESRGCSAAPIAAASGPRPCTA